MSIRLGSLFSGYGGLDLAVEMALGPTDPAFVSDIEPGPCIVLAHRFPDAPNLGDITKVDVSALPDVDVVAGGSPCQDMSLAGKRAGMREGTRSGLWSFQCDIVAAKRPGLVVWENVAGALSARAASRRDVEDADRLAAHCRAAGLCSCDEPDGTDTCAVCGLPVGERVEPPVNMRGLGRVLADLSHLGYDAAWRLLEAADVGAPHHRARVFVTAWPHDADAFPPADPYATFDPDMDVWLTDQPDLFGSATVFRDVWPKSGIMVSAAVSPVPGGWLDAASPRGGLLSTPNTMDTLPARSGEACERALRRGDLDRTPCASTGNLREDVMGLLPTPSAAYDSKTGSPETSVRRSAHGRQLGLGDVLNLLPTPAACDGRGGGSMDPDVRRKDGHRISLPDEVECGGQVSLLPTPAARDGGGGGSMDPDVRRRSGHQVCLPDEVERGGQVSLLPTPNTMDMLPPHEHLEELRASGRGGYSNLRDEIALLYTPKASDAVFGSPATAGRPLDKCGFLSTQVRLLNLPGRMTDEEIGRREGSK